MHLHIRTRAGRPILPRASLLAWLPIVLALVAACGGGTNGASY